MRMVCEVFAQSRFGFVCAGPCANTRHAWRIVRSVTKPRDIAAAESQCKVNPLTSRLDAAPAHRRLDALRLVAISFATLFFELALIRFTNSTVQVIAYFNNFLILSAFLGIGLGCVLAGRGRADWFARFPLILLGVITLMVLLDGVSYSGDLGDQVVWYKTSGFLSLAVASVIPIVFSANFAAFIPHGFELGRALARFRNPLVAYSWDLIGSLLGVAAFGLTAWFRTGPVVWFAIGGALVVLLMLERGPARAAIAALILSGAVLLSTRTAEGIWSPYYKVALHPYFSPTNQPVGFGISVDRLRIQDALKFGPELMTTRFAPWHDYYLLPYLFRHPSNVLILGGGSGNDATFALAEGARSVTVVEIDPVIVQLGYDRHPHRPYRDPRVRVVNDDARAFMRRDHGSYDLVVMNALDSHHQLPGLSTLRLESFMYTTEAFRDVRKRMSRDSLFVVHLSSSREWMGRRLYWSLTDAFGSEPALFTTPGSPFESVAFVYGPPELLASAGTTAKQLRPVDRAGFRNRPETDRATDDWPHLYLRDRRIPNIYLVVLGFILLITGTSFAGFGKLRTREDVHLFLLGAGFMLLETRSITKISLLFGVTWLVNAIVISGILTVVLLGNFLVLRGVRLPRGVTYGALYALLVIGYVVPINWILEYSTPVRIVLAALWVAAPIFFTSLIFSRTFEKVTDTATAFGANLLGVVTGGILEYTSMIVGLDALYLFALAIYAGAALVEPRGSDASQRAVRTAPAIS